MRKVFTLFAFLVFICTNVDAQFKLSKLTFGGGLGMQFGDYTAINFSPQVGYDFSKYLNAGGGVNYSYYSQKYDNKTYKQKNNYFGFNLYARLYPVSFLVLQIQPEIYRMWQSNEHLSTGSKVKTEKVVPTFLAGAGVRLGPVTAMLQYDVAQNDYSPYGNRLIYSVGYTFNF